MTRGPHHGRLDRAEPLANPARGTEGEASMRTMWATSAAILLSLALGAVPCLAQVATSDDTTASVEANAGGAEWPSAHEVRRALSEIGWVWAADSYGQWHGGPPSAKKTSGQAPVTLQMFEWIEDPEGETIRVFGGSEVQAVAEDEAWLIRVGIPAVPVYDPWPEGTTSSWTILAEVMDLLPLDGITRFEIRRMINEPGAPREGLYLPGGAVLFDDGQIQFHKHSEIQLLEE